MGLVIIVTDRNSFSFANHTNNYSGNARYNKVELEHSL